MRQETTMRLRLGLIAAVFCIAATASGSPNRRIVLLDFAGPRQLANAAQRIVMQVLVDQYDVVSATRWEVAKAATSGPQQWSTAAKATGAGAVVDGWVDPQSHSMIVAVRDAWNGRQIDTIAVKIGEHGEIADEQTRRLAVGIDDILNWIPQLGPAEPPPARLPPTEADRSYPSDEPVIEVTLTGGFVGHHQGAVVWADGTVQLFGPRCTQRRKLARTRVATLIGHLDRQGVFDARSGQGMCMDGLRFEIDVRSNNRRVAAADECGDAVLADFYNQVMAALGPNSCADGTGDVKGDDDDDDD
jgi:hypothetical protein